jgi:hypothetical protein
LLLVGLWTVVVAGCALQAVPVYRDPDGGVGPTFPVVERDDLMRELNVYLGTPYRQGGNSLAGIDCSGLSRAVYGALGVELHRRVVDQYRQGAAVSRRSMNTGDLVFFGKRGNPMHVGIAVSRSEMVHSSSSRGVVVEDIDVFSRSMDLMGIRRVARVR